MSLEFTHSDAFTMGVELELMILSTHDWDLMRGAGDLLALIEKIEHPGDIEPEITESMIEISTSVHRDYREMLAELEAIRDIVLAQAQRRNLAISGGGAHPFQHWSDQRIFPKERFFHLHEMHGYLAKQLTVFGQHIHIGVTSGDDAVYLTHVISRDISHFIALSASSPFSQGIDTAFDSSRLNNINAFPLSGTMPFVKDWAEFNAYVDSMRDLKVVESMKDFYWDIRPKPEFGTIEIRVCDTPLTVSKAAMLGAYAQALARHLMLDRPHAPSLDVCKAYSFNRFTACRYGLEGGVIECAQPRTAGAEGRHRRHPQSHSSPCAGAGLGRRACGNRHEPRNRAKRQQLVARDLRENGCAERRCAAAERALVKGISGIVAARPAWLYD